MPLSATGQRALAFTSFRKFAAVTGCDSCAFTNPRSAIVTARFWFTSPTQESDP